MVDDQEMQPFACKVIVQWAELAQVAEGRRQYATRLEEAIRYVEDP